MKCAKCGAELREGCLYCSRCGAEAQLISEESVMEEELLRSLLGEKDAGQDKRDDPTQTKRGTGGHPDPNRRIRLEQQKRKKRRNSLLLLFVLTAAALLLLFGLIRYRNSHSAVYLMEHAQSAYSRKDYDKALKYLNRMLDQDGQNEDALLMKGKICSAMKDTDQAETLLLEVLKVDPSCADAYAYLIRIYEKRDDTDSILALKEQVTDEELLSLFSDYTVNAPNLDRASGTYHEYFEVSITSDQKDVTVYYTLDGSTPTADSTRYEKPIRFDREGSCVLQAVCINSMGIAGEIVRAEYKISLRAPDEPTVTPDGGAFTTPTTLHVTVPAGCTVYYTWDGSTPSASSARCGGELEVPEGNNVLSLVAIDENGKSSNVRKCNYIYYPEEVSE